MTKDDNGWLGVIAALMGIAASFVTIAQAVKRCPCDGTPLPFTLYCSVCGHNHLF